MSLVRLGSHKIIENEKVCGAIAEIGANTSWLSSQFPCSIACHSG